MMNMNRKKHIHQLNHITQGIRTDLFGELDIFDFGNIFMVCLVFSTLASLALYTICVYCI